jgi:hypothetical protein
VLAFRLGVAASKFIAARGSLAELPASDAAAVPAAGAPGAVALRGGDGGDKLAKSSEERIGMPLALGAGTCAIAPGRAPGGTLETGFAAA